MERGGPGSQEQEGSHDYLLTARSWPVSDVGRQMAVVDPLLPVASARFGGAHFPESDGEIVAARAAPMQYCVSHRLPGRRAGIVISARTGSTAPPESRLPLTRPLAG